MKLKVSRKMYLKDGVNKTGIPEIDETRWFFIDRNESKLLVLRWIFLRIGLSLDEESR